MASHTQFSLPFIPMCLQSDCPCPRYIPQEDPPPGPRLCRDCLHWESLHAAPEPAAAKTASGMADVLARVKARMDKGLPSSAVSEDEARRETNAGFKKVSEEHHGRGGSTKYQVLEFHLPLSCSQPANPPRKKENQRRTRKPILSPRLC